MTSAPISALDTISVAASDPDRAQPWAELGLKDEAFTEDASGGLLSPIFQFRDRVTGELVAVFDLGLLEGEVPYPFVVQWEQYKLVRAAKPHIEASGIAEVRFSTKVTGLEQGADHVDVTIINAAGETEKLRGRCRVREPIGRRGHVAAEGGGALYTADDADSLSEAVFSALTRVESTPVPAEVATVTDVGGYVGGLKRISGTPTEIEPRWQQRWRC